MRLGKNGEDKGGRYAKGKTQDLILSFLGSGKDIARVYWSDGEYVGANSCQAAINKIVDRLRLDIKVLVSDGAVYLIRRDVL